LSRRGNHLGDQTFKRSEVSGIGRLVDLIAPFSVMSLIDCFFP
jgi:hypothetical protein